MDQLDRFVTCIIRDMKKSGFLDTIEKNVEFCIRKGFEMLTEITIIWLKNLIRKIFHWDDFQYSSKNTDNPIVDIIWKLIVDFALTDVFTIIHYIEYAINLLNKLLGRNMPEVFVPCRKKNTPIEEMQTVPVKSTSNTRQKVDKGKSVNEPRSISAIETKNTSNKQKANIGKSSKPLNKSINTDTIQKPFVSASTSVTEKANLSKNGTIGCIIGTGSVNNTNFRGVERKKRYYIGNVDLQTSPQNIIDHLKKSIPDGHFECRKLKCNGKRQSFKLTANFSSEVLNPEMWPVGVKVRPWVWKNKNSANSTQNELAISNAIQVA